VYLRYCGPNKVWRDEYKTCVGGNNVTGSGNTETGTGASSNKNDTTGNAQPGTSAGGGAGQGVFTINRTDTLIILCPVGYGYNSQIGSCDLGRGGVQGNGHGNVAQGSFQGSLYSTSPEGAHGSGYGGVEGTIQSGTWYGSNLISQMNTQYGVQGGSQDNSIGSTQIGTVDQTQAGVQFGTMSGGQQTDSLCPPGFTLIAQLYLCIQSFGGVQYPGPPVGGGVGTGTGGGGGTAAGGGGGGVGGAAGGTVSRTGIFQGTFSYGFNTSSSVPTNTNGSNNNDNNGTVSSTGTSYNRTTYNGPNLCGRGDGFYFPFPNDASLFLQCDIFGTVFVQPCPPKLVWDQLFYTCVQSTGNSNQTRTTVTTSNVTVSFNNGMRNTTTGTSGIVLPSIFFDIPGSSVGSSVSCINTSNSTQSFHPYPSNSSAYIVCTGGMAKVQNCKINQVWDQMLLACKSPLSG